MQNSLKYLFLFIVTFCFKISFSQTVIWSEDFDGNAGAGSNWGTLNQSIGAQGASANLWYISCQENGMAVGACGAGCGTNQTLHLGSSTAGDLGAAYDAGCDASCIWCASFGICSYTNTDKRSQSLNISTLGQSNLTLNFDYIENGDGANDNCIVEYSIDGGATWLFLVDPAKSTICGGGQGQWDAFSIALPVACENIPNLRIAFRWQNNADNTGTDPSFAVNDITITKPIVLPVELIEFNVNEFDNYYQLSWTTLSETNNDYFTLQRSENGRDWQDVTIIKGEGFSSETTHYSFNDYRFYLLETYYRLKQTDYNGNSYFSKSISIIRTTAPELMIYPNPVKEILTIRLSQQKISTIELYSQTGVLINRFDSNDYQFTTDMSIYAKGIYLIKVTTINGNVFYERVVND